MSKTNRYNDRYNDRNDRRRFDRREERFEDPACPTLSAAFAAFCSAPSI